MDKLCRARMIKGQVISMDRTMGKPVRGDTNFAAPDMRMVQVAGHWSATTTLAPQPSAGGPDEVGGWNLLHLHAQGELKFAVRFREHELEIIIFKPGPWERWFGTFDLSDREEISPVT